MGGSSWQCGTRGEQGALEKVVALRQVPLLQSPARNDPMTLGLFSPGLDFYVTATLPQWSESGSFRQKELCQEGAGGSGQQARHDLWWV